MAHKDEEQDDVLADMVDDSNMKISNSDRKAMRASITSEAKAMATMDGVDDKDDVIYEGDFEGALDRLKTMIASQKAIDEATYKMEDMSMDDQKSKNKKKHKKKHRDTPKDPTRWEFRGVHLGKGIATGKTMDDIVGAFVRWAQKPEDIIEGKFNISKAYRRIERFADFLMKYYDEFFSEPANILGPDQLKMQKYMSVRIPQWVIPSGEHEGCVMWTIDMGNSDFSGMTKAMADGEFTDKIMLSCMWGDMLCCMFDPPTQSKGVVILENLKGMSFSGMMAMNKNMKRIEHIVNELFYQTVPFKMREVVIVGTPWWMNMLMGLMRMFLSKKMSRRLVNTSESTLYEKIGGLDMCPEGFLSGKRKYVHRYKRVEESTTNTGRVHTMI